MPITKSAKKALRGSAKKHVFNLRRKKKLDESVKELKKTVSGSEKAQSNQVAMKSLSSAYKAIDKAAKGGLIKKGAADRKKSRLAAMVKKATA